MTEFSVTNSFARLRWRSEASLHALDDGAAAGIDAGSTRFNELRRLPAESRPLVQAPCVRLGRGCGSGA